MREKVWWFIDPAIHQVWATDSTNSRSMSIGRRSTMMTGDGAKEPETPDPKRKKKAINFASSATTITPTAANKEELKQMALIIVNLMVSDHIIVQIKNYNDPLSLWKRIKGLYDIDSFDRHILLKNQLYTIKMDYRKTMEEKSF